MTAWQDLAESELQSMFSYIASYLQMPSRSFLASGHGREMNSQVLTSLLPLQVMCHRGSS